MYNVMQLQRPVAICEDNIALQNRTENS